MEYNPLNWYWTVAQDSTQVFSSATGSHVPANDPAYLAWIASGGHATSIDTEANLGAVLYPYGLRPIPQAVLDGYLDAQMADLSMQPDYPLWQTTYVAVEIVRDARDAIHAIPAVFTPARFAQLIVQMQVLTDAMVSMLDAERPPEP